MRVTSDTLIKLGVSTASLVACLAMAVQVSAGTVGNGNKATVTLGGTINKAFLVVDDGKESRSAVVDNENDGSMFFINSEATVGEWTVGAYLATLFRDNPSNEVTIDDASAGNGSPGDRNAGATTFTQRNMEVSFSHPAYGKFTLGQGETSSDGAAEVDLSGTNVIGYSQVSDVAGAVKFRPATGGFGVSIGEVSDNLDGNDRDDRLRYDSPEFGGFTVSTSYASGGAGDVALS